MAPRLSQLAWLATLPLAGIAGARVARWDRHPLLSVANAATHFAYLPAYGALAVGLAERRRALAAVAGAVAGAHLAWTAPELRRARPLPPEAATAPRVRVVSANLRFSSGSKTQLGHELDALRPDVLLLQELAPEHLVTIKATGAFDAFPWSYVDARRGSFGAGIWSRYPLSGAETWRSARFPMVRARIDVDGTPVDLFNVHLLAPMRRRWIPVWKEQCAALLAHVAAADHPVIMAGDFNSTYGHAPFRRLLAGGLRDAHVEAGRGLATTWPNGFPLVPPLFRIDHVLVSGGIVVVSAAEGRGHGSDHRPVIADLAVVARP